MSTSVADSRPAEIKYQSFRESMERFDASLSFDFEFFVAEGDTLSQQIEVFVFWI